MNTFIVLPSLFLGLNTFIVFTKSISWSYVVGLCFGVVTVVTAVEWLALRSKFCEGNP